MANFTYGQLEGLWVKNGGSAALAPVMAAIALAESSGNPQAKNTTDNGGTQTSWGLWQVSNGTHNQPAPNILDPNVNAQQAVKKVKSQGLKAWGTYTSGAYRKFLKSGVSPVTSGLPTGSTSTAPDAQQTGLVGDIGGAIGSGFADAFTAVFKPLINTLIWGTEAFLGLALMTAGFLIAVANSQAGRAVEADMTKDALTVAEPELEAEHITPMLPKPKTTSLPSSKGGAPKSVGSKDEFRSLRGSGYKGPIRHDY
jgi:hypothetical protein